MVRSKVFLDAKYDSAKCAKDKIVLGCKVYVSLSENAPTERIVPHNALSYFLLKVLSMPITCQ